MENPDNTSFRRKVTPGRILLAAILLSLAVVAVLLVLTYTKLTDLSPAISRLRSVSFV